MYTHTLFRNLVLLIASAALSISLSAQSNSQTPSKDSTQPSAERMTTMDGAAGPCTILLTVTTGDGKPVYDSTVKVRVAYGIAGIKKLDMEAGTNVNGRVKFIGLPPRVHKAPLVFKATKDELAGSVTYDPLQECDASKSIVLKKSTEQ
jgi:hypothetical protein